MPRSRVPVVALSRCSAGCDACKGHVIVRLSKLTLQNLAALFSLPLYLLARPVLRWLGILRPGQTDEWIIGGHSGRLYADNSAALHRQLLQLGRRVSWISAEPSLTAQLERCGARVLRRNSFRARVAIENACVLAYSHSLTDLDHILTRAVALPALKVLLNHGLCYFKIWRTPPIRATWSDGQPPLTPLRGEPFDYFLACSERERQNVLQEFPSEPARFVLGSGAHLDAFMRARGQKPERLITYFPTFRESRPAKAELSRQVDALTHDPKLLAWLEREDYRLCIVNHINRGGAQLGPGRVCMASASELLDVVLASEVLVSDYSSIICDFLALDRPTLFFPFDKDDYLRSRASYVDYDSFVFGPTVRDVDGLVALITDPSAWRPAALEERRSYWTRELFPHLRPVYAQLTVDTIDQLAAQRAELVLGRSRLVPAPTARPRSPSTVNSPSARAVSRDAS